MAAQRGQMRTKAVAGPRRPSVEELAGAGRKRLRDVIGPGLSVLFCGINPGLYSAATGHHFARPGNRFWPTLFAAGFTPRLLDAFEDETLLELGLGITNLVARTTASADLLAREELMAGAKSLERKIGTYRPRVLAMVGLGAYRVAFHAPKAICGLQPRTVGETQVWLLPNPSGLNAHHQVADLAVLFGELRRHAAALPELPRRS
jgi:TDG/mug DNA glycosylase family protein